MTQPELIGFDLNDHQRLPYHAPRHRVVWFGNQPRAIETPLNFWQILVTILFAALVRWRVPCRVGFWDHACNLSPGNRVRTHGESTAATRNSAQAPDERAGERQTVPAGRRRPHGSGCSCSEGLRLIFWVFVPKNEVPVLYYPWFYEQVQSDNIKSITTQGEEIRGELRREHDYENPTTQTKQKVKKFITYAPTEQSLDAGRSEHHPRSTRRKSLTRPEARRAEEIGGSEEADGRRQNRSQSRPTRPIVWRGSCFCCRLSWSWCSST